MRYFKWLCAAAIGMASAHMAGAAPSAQEAAELGKSLTAFGAIKAGNKDGSIPEWTGGVCTPPAGYKPSNGDAGGAPYVDPFAADKPLFKIRAADIDKYADKLDEGAKALLRRNPDTFYVSVYPTRRSACFPNWMYENTVKKVMGPHIVGGSVPSVSGAHAQIPFPIPKSGVEAMWNSLLKPEVASNHRLDMASYLVDAYGNTIMTASQVTSAQNSYWDNNRSSVPEDQPYWKLMARTVAPASLAGGMQMLHYSLRPDLVTDPAWSYIPGQRRVRRAPEFAYDSVSSTSGGVLLYDEINGFSGRMDKFDFKLIGRKEAYVPYNAYTFYQAPVNVIHGPKHVNPDTLRFELHRVWVVEATLKPGERHVQKKKIFFIDEDSWNIVAAVGIDRAGAPHHLVYPVPIQTYEKPELRNSNYVIYDFVKEVYLNSGRFIGGVVKVAAYPPNYFTPDSMAGSGLR